MINFVLYYYIVDLANRVYHISFRGVTFGYLYSHQLMTFHDEKVMRNMSDMGAKFFEYFSPRLFAFEISLK